MEKKKKNNKETYGKVTVGYGGIEQRELEIVEYVQAKFKDNRLISISKLEDDTMVLSVESPPSTGRNAQSTIWLSKDSLIGLLSTASLYLAIKGEDLSEMIEDIVGEEVNYGVSDNLEQLNEKNINGRP